MTRGEGRAREGKGEEGSRGEGRTGEGKEEGRGEEGRGPEAPVQTSIVGHQKGCERPVRWLTPIILAL